MPHQNHWISLLVPSIFNRPSRVSSGICRRTDGRMHTPFSVRARLRILVLRSRQAELSPEGRISLQGCICFRLMVMAFKFDFLPTAICLKNLLKTHPLASVSRSSASSALYLPVEQVHLLERPAEDTPLSYSFENISIIRSLSSRRPRPSA